MTTMANSPFTRPTSVMSMLAEQMHLSCINEIQSNISSSAPIRRYSDTCRHCPNQLCDMTTDPHGPVSNDSDLASPQLPSKRLCHSTSNDSIARPIPLKVNNIASYFDNVHNATVNILPTDNRHSRMLCPKASLTIKPPQRSVPNSYVRPIISPHYKKSAFTPTRSQASPQTSSDYSISPDMESPIHRPASVTSSGFHDCSQQSLIDPNYSPDSNQVAGSSNCKVLPRCHSQPCDEPVSRNFNNRSIIGDTHKVCTCHLSSSKYPSQVHTPMKRRYPSLSHIRSNSQSENSTVQHLDWSTLCHCHRPVTNSADASPSGCSSLCSMPKREGYFFGSGRTYLISLPRIASSPPPVSLLVDPQNNPIQGLWQRIGSNSSSLSTSTTTDTNTPTVISNTAPQQRLIIDPLIQCNKDSSEDVNMDDSFEENRSTVTFQCYDEFDCGGETVSPPLVWYDMGQVSGVTTGGSAMCDSSCQSVSGVSDTTTTQSYSTSGSNGTSHCTNGSSRSEGRDHDDPPEIGFCFSQLSAYDDPVPASFRDQDTSFQELDIDQIELD